MELERELMNKINSFLELKEEIIKDCCDKLNIEVLHNYGSVNILLVDNKTSMQQIEELEKLFWFSTIVQCYKKVTIHNIEGLGIKIIY